MVYHMITIASCIDNGIFFQIFNDCWLCMSARRLGFVINGPIALYFCENLYQTVKKYCSQINVVRCFWVWEFNCILTAFPLIFMGVSNRDSSSIKVWKKIPIYSCITGGNCLKNASNRPAFDVKGKVVGAQWARKFKKV